MVENENEINLMDLLNAIKKRKWLIILPTFLIIIIVGIYSFLAPILWEIDSIIQPSKFLAQNENGEFNEILTASPKQIAAQISQDSYNNSIASELGLNIGEIPKIRAENLNDTNLIRISIKENNREKAKRILSSIFNILRKELDNKIEVEIKRINTEIATNENFIKFNGLTIKGKLYETQIKRNEIIAKKNDIKSEEIEKEITKQEISSTKKLLIISEERVKNIIEELKAVNQRIGQLEKQQQKAFEEKTEESSAIALLLYTNEIHNNLRYYNTLDEKLTIEKITQENLRLQEKEKKEEINQLDTEIEKLKAEINTKEIQINEIKNEMNKIRNNNENIVNEISLLNENKTRIDYTQLIKEPTSSLSPVAPKKKLNITIAGLLSLMIFTMLVFLLEYLKKQKYES